MDTGGKQRHPAAENNQLASLGKGGSCVEQTINRPPIPAHRAKKLFRPRGRVRPAQVVDSELESLERYRPDIGCFDALGKLQCFPFMVGWLAEADERRPC